jgi:hypothetical protein
MSDEADPLYQSLGGLEGWDTAVFDEEAWTEALDRLQKGRREDPDWAAMVERGMLLAAAYESAGLDGLYAVDRDLVRSLLLGEAALGAVDEAARPHVRANVDALRLARDAEFSEDSVRRIHEVACRPQLTHRVRVDERVQDHVLAAGDYKHHPNHILDAEGHWRATAPVAQVAAEMAALVTNVRSPTFAGLHPVVQAAYLLHALDHVQPFADGNGRVGRALASGCLLRAAGIPHLVLDGSPTPLVDVLMSAPRQGPALARWLAQEAAGAAIRRRLLPAAAEALERYRQRLDRRTDLSAAVLAGGEEVTIRVPVPHVEEVITVDAHREEGGGPPLLTAVEAGLRLDASPGTDLDGWLDRVVTILALRVAAELD